MTFLALSLGPVAAIFWWVYTRDREDPEPRALVAATVGLGAASVVTAYSLEMVGMWMLPQGEAAAGALRFGDALAHGLWIGAVEEAGKLLAVLVLAYRHPAFNERMDGIVYCVAASLGFAGVENLVYVLSGGPGVGLARAFTAVPSHAAYGVLMGGFVGMARMQPRRQVVLLLGGYLIALIAHALYDAVVFTQSVWSLLVLPILGISLIAGVVSIGSARRWDRARSLAFWQRPPLP